VLLHQLREDNKRSLRQPRPSIDQDSTGSSPPRSVY
jgi:hypothetical protein